MPIMVIAVLGAAPNAYFAIAWVIAYTLHLVNTNMGISLVAETASNPAQLARSVRHVMSHSMKLLVPLVVVTIAMAPLLLGIFGPEYRAATDTLRYLALAAILNVVASAAVSSARAHRRLGLLLSIQLTQCVVVLSLTWVLLHTASLVGAGLAWLIAQTLIAGGLQLLFRHQWMTDISAGRVDAMPVVRERRCRWLSLSSCYNCSPGCACAGSSTAWWLGRGRGVPMARCATTHWHRPLAECPEAAACSQTQPVRTVSDVAVAVLRSAEGESRAVVKLARSALGANEMRTQRLVLDPLAADPRLDNLRPVPPRVLTFRDTAEGTMSVETFRPGVDLADLLVRLPRQAEELTTAALASIAQLHRQTEMVTVVAEAHLDSWVGKPLATLGEVCQRMDPHLSPAVDHVGEMLRGALDNRRVRVSWTHGDFTPDNIRLDGADGPVTGIVDWGGARPGQLSLPDGYLLTLGVSRLVEARELGAIVRRRLRAGGLVPRERRPLRTVFHAADAAAAGGDYVDERAAILLTWLHHASDMWRKCTAYREHRIWWAANIAPVLRVVIASNLLVPAAAAISYPRPAQRGLPAAEPAERVRSTSTVAVVICAYTEDRWEDLTAAVSSVQNQTRPADEIVLVVDYCPALLARAAREFPDATVVENHDHKGLSGARNTGAATATADIVAFLDDDAVAAEDWIATLVVPYADPDVLGVGGRVLADWRAGRPSWSTASSTG